MVQHRVDGYTMISPEQRTLCMHLREMAPFDDQAKQIGWVWLQSARAYFKK